MTRARLVPLLMLLAACGAPVAETHVRSHSSTPVASSPASTPEPSLSAEPTPEPRTERSASRGTRLPARLAGLWIQDEAGPVLTYRRSFRFSRGGAYAWMVTQRNTGSTNEQVVAQESGVVTMRGTRLVFSPAGGERRVMRWRIERDPYVGDVRLVLTLPDGAQDVYFRP